MAEAAPKNGEFLEGKLWFNRKSNLVTIGLTSAAVEEIGTVQSIDFPDEGEDFEKGDIVLTVDGSTGKIEVITPASGVIQEINPEVKEEPEVASEDPTEEGWLFKIEVEDLTDLEELKSE